MLAERYANDNLSSILASREDYRPFPTADNREAWDLFDEDIRKEIVAHGEKYLGFEWPSLPATLLMEFSRVGDRSRNERPYFARRGALTSLVVAECIEGKGRFIDDIINGIWCICEESSWCIPAHNLRLPLADITAPIIDLFAAETSDILTWVHYLLGTQLDEVTEVICQRIRLEIKSRILDPYLERDDFWWMGFNLGSHDRVNNWNPWCNSNCLSSFLLMEEDEDRRIKGIKKILSSLDYFIDPYPKDGGCDEGTSYWGVAGASLFDCLELLYTSSEGRINVYDEPLIQDIGRFIYRMFISKDYFINFADGGARVNISANLVYRYGQRIGDTKLSSMGSSAYHRLAKEGNRRPQGSILRQLSALFSYKEIERATDKPPYAKDSWLFDIQVMAARELEGSDSGLYLAAKGGHNDESHNHNDIGNFIVYVDGNPGIIDAGVGEYTAKTFSSKRYEIWTMQSAYHNLPTVNGCQQQAGIEFRAEDVRYLSDESGTQFSLDIANAYPKQSGIISWRRTCSLVRSPKSYIEISDCFKLEEETDMITLSLMTPYEPCIDNSGKILFKEGNWGINYDGDRLTCKVEHIAIDDGRLSRVWGDSLFRILLKSKLPVCSDEWTMRIEKL